MLESDKEKSMVLDGSDEEQKKQLKHGWTVLMKRKMHELCQMNLLI